MREIRDTTGCLPSFLQISSSAVRKSTPVTPNQTLRLPEATHISRRQASSKDTPNQMNWRDPAFHAMLHEYERLVAQETAAEADVRADLERLERVSTLRRELEERIESLLQRR